MTVTPNGTEPNTYRLPRDHVSDGVYIVDLDRRILYWNEGAFRQTGYKSDEVVGRAVRRMGCVMWTRTDTEFAWNIAL